MYMRLQFPSCVTTDGISVSFHVQKQIQTCKKMPKNKKKKNETKIPDVKFINVKDVHPGMYGKHGDNCFFNLDENTTHAVHFVCYWT